MHGKADCECVVVKTPAEAGQTYDYIVCAHKAINQEAAAKQLAPAVEEGKTSIVIIQNGVGNEDPFRDAFPKSVILSCVVCPVSRRGVCSS